MINILIVGGGYIGCLLTCQISSAFNKQAKITVVEPSYQVREKWASNGILDGLDRAFDTSVFNNILVDSIEDIDVSAFDVVFICAMKDLDTLEKRVEYLTTSIIAPICMSNPTGGQEIVVVSTCIPGTIERLKSKFPSFVFHHMPEMIRMGDGDALKHPTRVVGGSQPISDKLRALLEGISDSIILVSPEEAEMCKVIQNSVRDVDIALANAVQRVCDMYSLDYKRVFELANMSPRCNLLNPGTGVGGHCIPTDASFLAAPYFQRNIFEVARKINQQQPILIAHKIIGHVTAHSPKGVAFIGLGYAPGSPKITNSTAVQVMQLVREVITIPIFWYDDLIHHSIHFDGVQRVTLSQLRDKSSELITFQLNANNVLLENIGVPVLDPLHLYYEME